MMAHILASPWMQVGRGVVAVISCLAILGVINMTKIDALTYGIPEDYIAYMLVGALVLGLISTILFRMKRHDDAADSKVASGKIDSTNALPYDKRYDIMTACSLILAMAVGMYLTPAVVDEIFINAGVFIHAGVAAILSGVFVWIFGYILHFGVQKFIVDAGKYAVEVIQTAKDTKEEVLDSLNKN